MSGGLADKGPVVLQRRDVPPGGCHGQFAGIRPAVEVGNIRVNKFAVLQFPNPLARSPEVFQPAIDLPGSGDCIDQVAHNTD